jgi:hypothetical protein
VEHGGFEAAPERTPGTYSKYNSIDDKIDDLHYWTTHVKFGIGRATYDAAQEIRSGEITREEGVALVHRFDGEWPARFEDELMAYLSIPTSALERWMVAGWRPRNFGAKLATGEWIVWISDDDEFLVNGVELLLKAARTDPSAEIVTAAYQSGSIGPRIFRPADGVRDVGFPFGGTGWMMRAHLVGFRWNGHSWRKARDRPCDYDLVVRLRDAGARFLAVDHVVVIQHEVAGTGMIGRRGALAAAGEDPDAE